MRMEKFTRFSAALAIVFGLGFGYSSAYASVELLSTADFTLVSPMELIKWKVGDTMQYKVSIGAFGSIGSSSKTVTKDEGAAIWVRQTMNLVIQNETVDILIDKTDGKVLKLVRNGKEQPIPDDKMEIISQEYEEVTVPAGKFQSLHIIAKTKDVPKLEVWVNPQDTVMDGALKQIMKTQLGDITLELTSFKHGQ
jgi:hypothetical protein